MGLEARTARDRDGAVTCDGVQEHAIDLRPRSVTAVSPVTAAGREPARRFDQCVVSPHCIMCAVSLALK